MKLENAIKKLSKVGKVEQAGGLFWARVNNSVVEFCANGRIEKDTNAICFRVRGIKDEDDTMTDYFAGVWCDNLSQAIRIASRV